MSVDSNGAALAALARCREKIDLIDRRLVDLLNERTIIVEEIGRVKRDAQLAIYEPKRETQVFENITSHNAGPLGSDSVKRIFERVIDEMRRVQKDRMAESARIETPPIKTTRIEATPIERTKD
jgi:chorismate mutase/prephenate dehydratase